MAVRGMRGVCGGGERENGGANHLIRITAGEHGLADGIVGHRTRARALLSGVKRLKSWVSLGGQERDHFCNSAGKMAVCDRARVILLRVSLLTKCCLGVTHFALEACDLSMLCVTRRHFHPSLALRT